MTMTFPTIPVRNLDIKRYVVGGVALLAAAASIVAVQTVVSDSSPAAVTDVVVSESVAPTIGFDPGQNVSTSTDIGHAHSAEIAQFAATQGLSGLSPASLGPVAAAPQLDVAQLGSGGFMNPDAFMRAIADAAVVATAPEAVVELGSDGFTSPDAFLRANTRPTVEAATPTFDGSVAWLQANGWLPEVEAATEALSRSNFGSDIDWLTANGWADTGR